MQRRLLVARALDIQLGVVLEQELDYGVSDFSLLTYPLASNHLFIAQAMYNGVLAANLPNRVILLLNSD